MVRLRRARGLVAGAAGLGCVLAGGAGAVSPITLVDTRAAAGITHRHFPPAGAPTDNEMAWMSGGAVAEDLDGDGWCDFYFLAGGHEPNGLYLNNGDGTFREEAAARGVAIMDRCFGAAAADIDGDGDIDLSITTPGSAPRFLENTGGGFFQQRAGMPGNPAGMATSLSWGDIDGDGRLDFAGGDWSRTADSLFLYRQVAPWTFEPVALFPLGFQDFHVFTPRFSDVTGNGLPDLLVASDFGYSNLYHNLDGRRFQRVTPFSGTALDQNGMGAAVGDFDNDGDQDWLVTAIWDTSPVPWGTWRGDGNFLYANNSDGTFANASEAAGVRDGNWGWGATFADLDNDGWLDIFHVNGWGLTRPVPYALFGQSPPRLFQNQGDGSFVDVAAAAGAGAPAQGRSVACLDFDRDGDVDILVVNNQDLAPIGGDIARSPGTPQLFRNDSVNDNAWLVVELQGVGAGQHPHGIGARVEVHGEFGLRVREIHASSGYLGGDQGRLAHFGLGEDPGALEVRVRWPAGDWSFVPATAGQELAISGLHSLVSTREALVGELVQANGAALPPLGAARRWVVEGQAHADPLSLSFATEGTRQLRLDVLAPDGVTVVRSEVREVRVAHGRGEAGLVFQ